MFLQTKRKILVYFLSDIFYLKGRFYQLFDDKINGVFFKNNINIMVFEKVQFNLLDFIIMGFDLFYHFADVQRIFSVTRGNYVEPRGRHRQAIFIRQVLLIFFEVFFNIFFFLLDQSTKKLMRCLLFGCTGNGFQKCLRVIYDSRGGRKFVYTG